MNNRQKKLKRYFGVNEYGYSDVPAKIGNVKIARMMYGAERGCSFCFPHGFETNNSSIKNSQRSWKKNRKKSYKK